MEHIPTQDEVRALGAEILERASGTAPSLFDPRNVETAFLNWAMRDPGFQTDLFRFLDVLPSLTNDRLVARHVREYLLRENGILPGPLQAAVRAASGGLLSGVASHSIRYLAARFGRRFIAAGTIPEALKVLRRLDTEGYAFSADLLGETTLSDREALACYDRYEALIRSLGDRADTPVGPRTPFAGQRAEVSLKVSALDPHLDPVNHDASVEGLTTRLLPLALLARRTGVGMTLDLEQCELQGITYDVFEALAQTPELRDWTELGVVLQAYLLAAPERMRRLQTVARMRGAPVKVRLVKGAYWDHEVAFAAQRGLPPPVHVGKGRTDASFEDLAVEMLGEPGLIRPAFGSHNARSIAWAMAAARGAGLPPEGWEVQMLLGLAEPMREALRDMGVRVRVYSPIGALLPGIAYLVRRLLEGTANTGFLRQTWFERRDPDELLAKPLSVPDSVEPRAQTAGAAPDFSNVGAADFADRDVLARYRVAIRDLPQSLPISVPVAWGGRERMDRPTLERFCSGQPTLQVTRVALAHHDDVQGAVSASLDAWPAWRDLSVQDRARTLERLADLLDRDRPALAALECFEVSKPLREADADVCEAIDFCRYYARQARTELAPQRLGSIPGEENHLLWEGRGPTAVIAPWNFPIAILTGMSVAALVAGNTVLLKPAEQSSGLGFRLYGHMLAAGFPPDVVQLLPGTGEAVGAALVAHPGVAQIAFTGSRAVGLRIWAQAARTTGGQPWLKRVVCEMGGKNAVIVDDDADLDEAVSGVMRGAFGYAGQKCSACSRVIVVGGAVDVFVRRMVEAASGLVQARAHEPRCELPPVIDREAWERLHRVIRETGQDAEPLYVGNAPTAEGHFVPPALFLVRDPGHPLMQEELFGPVLAVYHAGSFDEALDVAARSEYALTAGVYSRSPAHIAEARRKLRVGNLYINRHITGAMVGRQPFGGFAMSGGGTKAGGPGYLMQFAQPRSICENTERRGFVPRPA